MRKAVKKTKSSSKPKKSITKKRGLKRKASRYPGLEKGVNGKFRQESIDFDYLDKLSPKEREFLSNFMEEWNGANMNHPGKKFHKSKKDRKKCYDRNNARQRDIYNHKKNMGLLVSVEDNIKEIDKKGDNTTEDLIIEKLDKKNEDVL
jgi:hypothetical protein